MKKRMLRALICALLIAILALPAQANSFVDMLFSSDDREEAAAPAVTPAPDALEAELAGIEKSKLRDDGVVRVWLKSLGNLSSLSLKLRGNYTLGGSADTRFESGAKLCLSDGGDAVYLSVGGFIMKLDKSVRLVCHASEETDSGVYIEETGHDTLYPGDLVITRNEDGGLRCVLHAPVEEYLRGVIAYEMSDAWPLDALKAQAVAARTYVMQRKQGASKRDYDVSDTTSDQVFKGVDPAYANVTAAVRGTAGVVGTWKGKYATCYYTASNGGQTALPEDVWDATDGDFGYLARTLDSADLENPLSVVKSYAFDYDLEGADDLRALLEAGIPSAAEARGIQTDGLEIEEIAAVEAVDPVAEGSLMFRKLRFDLVVSAPRTLFRPGEGDVGAIADATGEAESELVLGVVDGMRRLISAAPYEEVTEREPLEEMLSVELDVYTDVKHSLGLKINSSDCEKVSVSGDGFGYVIEMRCFGHGVGMSQRGAQRMAGVEEKSWLDILSFYYPGMKLERVEWETPELSELPPVTFSTVSAVVPTPTPAPLPELKEGETYAQVVLGDVSSSLNMRAEPTTESEVNITLSDKQRLIVCGEANADGWVAVRTAEASGYVREEYLKKEK